MTSNATLRSLGAALAGLVGYGTWAWYANLDHGQAMAVRAGLLQGSYSFALTFSSTLLMEWLFSRFAQSAFARTWTIAATGMVLLVVPISLHLLAGTPEILMTIAPGFLVGMVYTASYVTALARLAGYQRASPPP